MIRILSSIAGTIAALALLLGFKTQSPIVTPVGSLPQASLSSSGATSTSASTPSPAASATQTSGPPDPTSPSSTSTTPTPTPAGSTTKTYDGSAITTRYGIVQVRVSVKGSTITDVSFLQLTAFDRHSQEINSDAGQQLLNETLTAQSSQIDTVSGASYTSAGYVQSLQNALDQAGLH